MTRTQVVRQDSDFLSDSQRCAAWLYRPAESTLRDPPIIVMAHGFAAERTFHLPDYASKFADCGLAVLLFDYRHFGDSEGEPRNMVDHRRQHRDWLAAVDHVKTIVGIDGKRIGLWGTSLSGGHVVSVAAGNHDIGAIVSQTPMVDMLLALRVNAKFVAAAFWHGAQDYMRALLGRPPHYIRTVAPPSQFAAMNQEGCDAGYRALVPADSGWPNECTARSLLSSLLFRPSRKASLVSCPAMLVIAERDQVIRARVIEKVASEIPRGEVLRYPVDHFEIYQGEIFEELSRLQGDFFTRHLIELDSSTFD